MLTPSRRSSTLAGLAGPVGVTWEPSIAGSKSSSSFDTTARLPRCTSTRPRYSFVYAFWIRTTSPFASSSSSGFHAVYGTVPVGSPRNPYTMDFAPSSVSICLSFTETMRASRETFGSPGTRSRTVFETPSERSAGFPPCFFTIDRFAVSRETRYTLR